MRDPQKIQIGIQLIKMDKIAMNIVPMLIITSGLVLLVKELEKGVNTLLVPIDGISLPTIERNEQQEQASRAFIS